MTLYDDQDQSHLCFMLSLTLLAPAVLAVQPAPQVTPKATQNDVVFTHLPAPGLYWNNHKLANFPVALYLRLRFGKLTEYGGSVTGSNITKVELYAQGYLMITYTQPPYSWSTPGMHVRILGATPTLTAKVYLKSGDVLTDNMTIYRLF